MNLVAPFWISIMYLRIFVSPKKYFSHGCCPSPPSEPFKLTLSLKLVLPNWLWSEVHELRYMITNVAKMVICLLRRKQIIDHLLKRKTKLKKKAEALFVCFWNFIWQPNSSFMSLFKLTKRKRKLVLFRNHKFFDLYKISTLQ